MKFFRRTLAKNKNLTFQYFNVADKNIEYCKYIT